MDYLENFPENVSSAIKSFITEFRKNNPDFFGANAIIRDDIFSILEKKATVVFFPLEDEENDGFHVRRTIKENKKDFVYINTAKAVEKQVFTAAHELGHRLEIEKYIAEHCSDFDTERYKENIVNRFAALLLLPEDEFKKIVTVKLNELENKEKPVLQCHDSGVIISISDVFRLIAFLMDYFFVPFKTVVYRLSETGVTTRETREKIFSDYDEKLLSECIKDGKYLRLNKPNYRKYISGYSELLEKAELAEVVPIHKIKMIREQFDIPKIITNDAINLTLNIKE